MRISPSPFSLGPAMQRTQADFESKRARFGPEFGGASGPGGAPSQPVVEIVTHVAPYEKTDYTHEIENESVVCQMPLANANRRVNTASLRYALGVYKHQMDVVHANYVLHQASCVRGADGQPPGLAEICEKFSVLGLNRTPKSEDLGPEGHSREREMTTWIRGQCMSINYWGNCRAGDYLYWVLKKVPVNPSNTYYLTPATNVTLNDKDTSGNVVSHVWRFVPYYSRHTRLLDEKWLEGSDRDRTRGVAFLFGTCMFNNGYTATGAGNNAQTDNHTDATNAGLLMKRPRIDVLLFCERSFLAFAPTGGTSPPSTRTAPPPSRVPVPDDTPLKGLVIGNGKISRPNGVSYILQEYLNDLRLGQRVVKERFEGTEFVKGGITDGMFERWYAIMQDGDDGSPLYRRNFLGDPNPIKRATTDLLHEEYYKDLEIALRFFSAIWNNKYYGTRFGEYVDRFTVQGIPGITQFIRSAEGKVDFDVSKLPKALNATETDPTVKSWFLTLIIARYPVLDVNTNSFKDEDIVRAYQDKVGVDLSGDGAEVRTEEFANKVVAISDMPMRSPELDSQKQAAAASARTDAGVPPEYGPSGAHNPIARLDVGPRSTADWDMGRTPDVIRRE